MRLAEIGQSLPCGLGVAHVEIGGELSLSRLESGGVGVQIVIEIIGSRWPDLDNETGRVCAQLNFEIMGRVDALRAELLSRKILAVREVNALELVLPSHQVDRAKKRVKLKVGVDICWKAMRDLTVEQKADALVYLDELLMLEEATFHTQQ